MNILNASSKIGLMVAALLLLASGILSTIGEETMASRFELAGCSVLVIGIVLLLILSIRRTAKGMDEDKG